MKTILKKNNQGFTLVELMVAFVVGTVMAAAIYFSYGIFSNSYQVILEKESVNRALRVSMNEITKNIKKAGYVDPNRILSSDVRWTYAGYNFNSKIISPENSPLLYLDGASNSEDTLAIMYDLDLLNMQYISFQIRTEDNIKYLMKTEYRCTPKSLGGTGSGCTNWDNERIFANIETMQFTFYDQYGTKLVPSTANKGSAIFGNISSSINPLIVNYVEISLIFKSTNPIYTNDVTKTFSAGGNTYSYTDKYYRDILTASVYPRNIIKK